MEKKISIILGILLIGILSFNFISAFQLEKHLIQTEVDEDYPCHIELGDTIVCPALDNKAIDDWKDKIQNIKGEEKDKGILKDTEKISKLNSKKTLYEGKVSKEIDLTKEYREKINIYSLGDNQIKIGFATNTFGVSGTPLENFDVNTTTGMVRYRPLNMTWLNLGTNRRIAYSNYNMATQNITFSIWLNLSGAGTNNLFGGGDTSATLWLVNFTRIMFRIAHFGGIEENITYDYDLRNKWTNIIATRNHKNLTLYINGVLVNDTNFSTVANPQSNGLWGVGFLNSVITGQVDEARFYNRTITQAEVTSIFNQGRNRNVSVVNDNNLIWYLPMNENSGLTAYDLSRYSINGTITSGATWQSDNINVSTLGYNVNISLVNITNAYIYWDNGTTWNNSFSLTTGKGNYTGNATLTFLNNQTIWVKENYLNPNPPVITVTNPTAIQYKSGTIPIEFSATDDYAVDTLYYSVNGVTYIYTASTQVILTEPNTYVIRLYANDTSNNIAESDVTFSFVYCDNYTLLGYRFIVLFAALGILIFMVYNIKLEVITLGDLLVIFITLIIAITMWVAIGQIAGANCGVIS